MASNNRLKEKIKNGETVLGTWCILPSPSVINVIAAARLDFVIIDMEHGPIGFETAEDMVRAAQSEDCSAIVRVPKNDESDILRALDIGADGIVIPHIEKVEDRKRAIKSIKYFPIGERGFSPFTRAGSYDPADPAVHTKRENEKTMTVLIIEGVEGVKNLDSIIDDQNIDVVYFGLCDLSQAIGVPGKLDDPKLKEYVSACVKKVKDKNMAVGAFTDRPEMLKWFKEIGIQFITYSLDTTELCRSFKHFIKDFNDY
ncbi:MAG: aldolase [Candidatus Saganbacteria bacterium]|nr:aldolase [Candidatus Saganbacteria bacterium]